MKIKELLDSPDKWTQGANARDIFGKHAYPSDEKAIYFCLQGAIQKCYGSDISTSLRIEEKIINKLDSVYISVWNDAPERTFEEVKTLVNELDI